uniref:Uncharacterized protein n=1 Tax=Cacopsylla melanoneura TaxID=428564 RepID=A0A8D8Z2B5_9HEMI
MSQELCCHQLCFLTQFEKMSKLSPSRDYTTLYFRNFFIQSYFFSFFFSSWQRMLITVIRMLRSIRWVAVVRFGHDTAPPCSPIDHEYFFKKPANSKTKYLID